MAMPSPLAIEQHVRRAYEKARIRQSILDALPALVLAIAMWCMQPGWTNAALGGLVLIGVIVLRWVGRAVSRGVGPGLALAWIPLLLPAVAFQLGHVCTPNYCHSVCRIACGIGGIVTGFLLARLMKHCGFHPLAWLVSGSILVASSVAGCQCVGVASLVAFVVGLGVSSGTAVVWRLAHH